MIRPLHAMMLTVFIILISSCRTSMSPEASAVKGYAISKAEAWESGTIQPYGPYDPKSIMNYCVTHQGDYAQPLTLSAGDIATLRTLYPK